MKFKHWSERLCDRAKHHHLALLTTQSSPSPSKLNVDILASEYLCLKLE
ncbi:hypothetical protein CDL12_07109 [Handroanthus impetiginosus]|uniref:Uncharacterized protein n=1 Tax=Handroanthus impetiginosus TaxID=429701 RepID=A0A2G9HRS0_9LAMI|nr:hypothetical protein CDL12_07109 [Handroanthus impetiginosus]